ncbi:hypothetical protein JCGZ_03699 [Jatropha curcas]|uniref:Uncharacterized protein n=1 Tax=Jatropha curcas TaxID=180498 RepID=A0A067KTD8_JATCU|nr:hypothetical protein JCGZ_03699 [Jatropha curcas]
MLNIWDDCSSDEEGKVPVKIEIEKSITVKVGDVPEDEDEKVQLAIQKSLADQEEQWYYSSEEDVNESRGKTYPGVEIFMTDYEEKLIKSPEPSLE